MMDGFCKCGKPAHVLYGCRCEDCYANSMQFAYGNNRQPICDKASPEVMSVINSSFRPRRIRAQRGGNEKTSYT